MVMSKRCWVVLGWWPGSVPKLLLWASEADFPGVRRICQLKVLHWATGSAIDELGPNPYSISSS